MTQSRTFSTRIDIRAEAREKLIALLNQQLADTFDLYSQAKYAHWNVKGMQFYALHLLFDTLAESVEDHVDMIAERVTALGGTATGTARMSAATSSLSEFPVERITGPECVAALADRFGVYGATTRAAIDTATELGDADTADLFTEISRAIDKHLYFLEAHLQA